MKKARAITKTVCDNDEALDEELDKEGLAQNRDKKEILASMSGARSKEEMEMMYGRAGK